MKFFKSLENKEDFQYERSNINRETDRKIIEKEKEVVKKDTSLFCAYLVKLSAMDLLGIATLLGVGLYHQTYTKDPKKALPREGEDIIKDCIVRFNAASRSTRREILQLCKKAIKASR